MHSDLQALRVHRDLARLVKDGNPPIRHLVNMAASSFRSPRRESRTSRASFSLSYAMTTQGELLVVRGGELDISSAEQAFSCVRDVIDRHKVPVVVDLAPGSAQSHGRPVLVTMAPTARHPQPALITVGTSGGDEVLFVDRRDAGRHLVQRLRHLRGADLAVLGVPRGGVPVAFEAAEELHAPLDVIVIRKLGVPFQPEYGFGAVGEGGVRIIDDYVVRRPG